MTSRPSVVRPPLSPCAEMNERSETFVSVDIEASGPSPSIGSLLSIGACLVDDPSVDFYVELKPIDGHDWDDHAETVHELSIASTSCAKV